MKIAFKNFLMTLRRYKVASLLNVLGLTLAFVAFYIIASQVWYTVTYNRSIENSDRVFIVSPHFGMLDEERNYSTNSPAMAFYDAVAASPDVEAAASLIPYAGTNKVWTKVNNYNYQLFEEEVYMATADIFDCFGFECLVGDFSRIKEPNTVAISESVAEKMNVGIGDVIYTQAARIAGEEPEELPSVENVVVAVYSDMDINTFLGKWQIITYDDGAYTTTNNNWNYSNFVRLREGAEKEAFLNLFQHYYSQWYFAQVEEWMELWPEDEDEIRDEAENGGDILDTRLVALEDTYYRGNFNANYIFETGNGSAPIILTTIALVIVIIAFINFVNFFFALVPVRMRAVNICKVFGASQWTLRWNFLFEAIGLVLISMALTFYLMIAIQESFITQYVTCSLALGDNIPVIMMMVGLMILLALVAALYPAFYITRFNASLGVKGGFAQSATGRRLRSVMVGVQFSVAMILIIVTAVFFLQYRYMVNYDMGFKTDNIVTFTSFDMTAHADVFTERIMQHPDAEDVTSGSTNMFRCNSTSGMEHDEKIFTIYRHYVRHNFLSFFDLEVVDGSGFTPLSAERKELVVMSDQQEDIGTGVGWICLEDSNKTVGVIEDIELSPISQSGHYDVFFCASDDRLPHYYVRLREGADVKAFADYIRATIKEIVPRADEPDLYFLNDWIEGMYKETKKVMVLIGLFAVLAIVIALMGVFGIVMFETQHRRSEIAVRKVYGATTRQIVEMLNLRYVWIVGGCFVVAAPVAWYITSRWLEQFANRIASPWWIYVVALAVVLAVTVGLVTLRSWKAATENPADVVKSN